MTRKAIVALGLVLALAAGLVLGGCVPNAVPVNIENVEVGVPQEAAVAEAVSVASADVSPRALIRSGIKCTTGDNCVEIWNGGDIVLYSDTGTTQTYKLDAATGNIDAEGTLDVAGATALAGDITLSDEATGGNAEAVNQIIGLPRMVMVDLATGTNPASQSVDCMDATPAGEWAEVDAGTNVAVTADTSYFRADTNSIKLAVTDAVENDGLDVTLPGQDDMTDMESIAFWMYSDTALTSGDLDLTIDDSDGTDQVYSIGAVPASVWTWVELDVSACDSNCDTADGFFILFTSQGETNLDALNIYVDELIYWDAADEEALGQDIVDHGVITILTVPTAFGTNNTLAVPVEWTDYFVHYETGDDFIVWISDQSANEALALVAY